MICIHFHSDTADITSYVSLLTVGSSVGLLVVGASVAKHSVSCVCSMLTFSSRSAILSFAKVSSIESSSDEIEDEEELLPFFLSVSVREEDGSMRYDAGERERN